MSEADDQTIGDLSGGQLVVLAQDSVLRCIIEHCETDKPNPEWVRSMSEAYANLSQKIVPKPPHGDVRRVKTNWR